tara:strand:+ start:5565 stop:6509 length:945 start_codon:yes stop_codon:yes gene_type:complete
MILIISLAIMFSVVIGLVTQFFVNTIIPPVWYVFKSFTQAAEQKLNRQGRSKQDVIFRGFLTYICVLALAVVVYFVVAGIEHAALSEGTVIVFQAVLLSLSISTLSLPLSFVNIGHKRLNHFGRAVGLDLASQDFSGRIRKVTGLATIIYARGLVSPILWFWFGGVAGLLFYTATQVCSFYTNRYDNHLGFALIPNVVARIMNLVPDAIAGCFLVLCSLFVPGLKFKKALKSLMFLKDAPVYGLGGIPLHILSYASSTTLGGPVKSLDGQSYKNEWVGEKGSSAQLTAAHPKIFIFTFSVMLVFTLFACILLVV